ncbi:hypothetical protein [Nocardiopsis sp. FR26]|uniref:hypothetical protein n=1 Tax=Nocardiopsis sp. FR26 TaxID=2605987 RepID=UPI00135CE54D|nr:hypothetical protein [Nocardiopsis sp. FR26]
MPRYLHPTTLEVVRQRAEERLRWRRPRHARRVRDYVLPRPATGPGLDVLHRTLAGLHRLEAAA